MFVGRLFFLGGRDNAVVVTTSSHYYLWEVKVKVVWAVVVVLLSCCKSQIFRQRMSNSPSFWHKNWTRNCRPVLLLVSSNSDLCFPCIFANHIGLCPYFQATCLVTTQEEEELEEAS
jgi:hypothetical protein